MNRNLCKTVISNGGSITPLLIDPKDSKGLGLMNPSIFIDNGRILLNLRNINYTLYHCEGQQLFNNRWGPLSYLHPENDMHLRTWNYMCDLEPQSFEITNYSLTDTTQFDKDPLWDFVGLEDARLFKWEGKYYQCGVRRDTTPNGVGRMELSEIEEIEHGKWKEVSRTRIEPPGAPTYCEKNWMPVTDMPWHFVKWTNPTEVVKVDPVAGSSKTVYLGEKLIPNVRDLRGGSHVIPWKGYHIALLHEVDMLKNRLEQKDATYLHRFIAWDKDWNVAGFSDSFSFMDGEIEFCAGMAVYKNDLIVTFGFQDNAAYLLRIPEKMIADLFKLDIKEVDNNEINSSPIVNTSKEKWKNAKWPSFEITTSIPEKGCIMSCVFCPQQTLLHAYKGERKLTLENFKKVIDKIPKEVTIIFSGFVEPWLNSDATEMAVYAHETGHAISIFTTGVGMTIEDIEKIKTLNFSIGPENPLIGTNGIPMINGGFVLHLPDNENYAHHPITEYYIKFLEHVNTIKSEIPGFRTVCMGTVHESVKHIFPEVSPMELWARADNLVKEEIFRPEISNIRSKYHRIFHEDVPMTCNADEELYHNVLLPNGDVVLCCMDYNLEHILGNLFTQEYNDILPEYKTPFKLCRFCENGIPVKFKK